MRKKSGGNLILQLANTWRTKPSQPTQCKCNPSCREKGNDKEPIWSCVDDLNQHYMYMYIYIYMIHNTGKASLARLWNCWHSPVCTESCPVLSCPVLYWTGHGHAPMVNASRTFNRKRGIERDITGPRDPSNDARNRSTLASSCSRAHHPDRTISATLRCVICACFRLVPCTVGHFGRFLCSKWKGKGKDFSFSVTLKN